MAQQGERPLPKTYPGGLKDMYKLCHANFVDFVKDYNFKKTSGELTLNDGDLEALKALHDMWKNSKQHLKAVDVAYFYKMKDHHTVLNGKLSRRVNAWDTYVYSTMTLRTTLMRVAHQAMGSPGNEDGKKVVMASSQDWNRFQDFLNNPPPTNP